MDKLYFWNTYKWEHLSPSQVSLLLRHLSTKKRKDTNMSDYELSPHEVEKVRRLGRAAVSQQGRYRARCPSNSFTGHRAACPPAGDTDHLRLSDFYLGVPPRCAGQRRHPESATNPLSALSHTSRAEIRGEIRANESQRGPGKIGLHFKARVTEGYTYICEGKEISPYPRQGAHKYTKQTKKRDQNKSGKQYILLFLTDCILYLKHHFHFRETERWGRGLGVDGRWLFRHILSSLLPPSIDPVPSERL